MSKFFSKMDPAFAKCPNCKSIGNMRRSRARSFYEKVVKAVKIFKIYRCTNCGWRGIKFSIITTKQFLKNIAFLIVLALITSYIVRYVITRYAMD